LNAKLEYADYSVLGYRYAEFHILRVKTIATKRHKCLAKWLRAEREAKGLNQTDVAKCLRRSQSWITKLETGQRPIHVIEFLALARAIGFDAVKMLRKLRDEIRENSAK
jgi:ribosome-binding protein aMBF1 (putative translation factor)